MTAPLAERAEAPSSTGTRNATPEKSAASAPDPVAEYLAQLKADAEGVVTAGLAVPRRFRRVLSTKMLRKKAAARRLAILVAMGAVGGVVALTVLLMAVALVLYGLSHAIANGLGFPFWAGAALMGLATLVLFAAAGYAAWTRYGAAQRRSVGQKVSAEPAPAPGTPAAGHPVHGNRITDNPATGAAA